jgi:hypothetical protein
LPEVDELKVTRFEKVSFAGVPGFEGGLDKLPFNGVDLPETGGVGRRAAKAELEVGGGGLLVCKFEEVQSSPERSSIAVERGHESQHKAQE